MMKNLMAAVMVTCSAFALTAGAAKAADNCKVGISVYTLNSRFMHALEQAAITKAKELGCAVVSTDAQNDLNKQLGDIEDMISGGVNVLVVDPFNLSGLDAAVHTVAAKGIPVVAMDNTIDAKADVLTMVQSSNIQNGTMVGEWVAKQMKGKPMKIALLSGQQGSGAGLERRDGLLLGIFEEQLREIGGTDFQVVAQAYTDWTATQGLKAMEDILTAHPEINVVLSEADIINLGAMKVLEEKGHKDVLIAAAADGQKEALALIKQGAYGASGSNNPTAVGGTAVEIAVKAFRKELSGQIPRVTLTKAAAITKENIDQFYDPNSIF